MTLYWVLEDFLYEVFCVYVLEFMKDDLYLPSDLV